MTKLRCLLLLFLVPSLVMVLVRWPTSALPLPDPPLMAGANINMAGGPVRIETDDGTPTGNLAGLIEGDPFFTKQNELSFAVSSRNPRHLLAGANDYRAVNLALTDTPPSPGAAATGDVWGGVFISLDQGRHWRSTLLPCYPQDTRPECANSPLSGFEAVADPQVRAGTHGLFYYCGIVFDRGENADGAVFCSRFVDLNNVEGVDFPLSLPNPADPAQVFASPIQWVDHNLIQSGTSGQFLDKISAVADIVRRGAQTETIAVPLNCDPTANTACSAADAADGALDGFITQTIPCGAVYVAYADFTGGLNNPNSKLLVSRSRDCGRSWDNATVVNQTQGVSQGAVVKVAPNGRVSVAWRQFGLDGELDSIWIAHQDAKSRNNFKFDPPVKVADLEPFDGAEPFDLPTRAADLTDSSGNPIEDPYTGFRVNTYPTMAVDSQGRYYVAWSQRGWGADVDGDASVNDGARIVLSTSSDGLTWSAPTPVDPQLPAAGDPTGESVDPALTAPQGHQIMPHLSVVEGRIGMVFYDFRDDVFPGILRDLRSEGCDDDATEDLNGDGVANFVDCCISEVNNAGGADGTITVADCQKLAEPEFLESLIPADPANFAPLPVRHTVDTFVAEALPGANPVFTVTKASDYTKVLVPRLDGAGTPIPNEYDVVQLRFHSANFPLYGGDKAFMGDYIEFNGADIIAAPDGSGWEQNLSEPPCKPGLDCRHSPVAHVAFSDTRDVVPPAPTVVTDPSGRQVLQQDWSSDYVGQPGRARMLDQNPYTTRLTGGVVLGSPGSFKPLFTDPARSRAFALILENTLDEGTLSATSWQRGSRFYRLSFEGPNGADVSFTPDFTTSTLDVEVQSLSAVGATLFVRRGGGNDLTPTIAVYANEIDTVGGDFKSGGLQASTLINPDPTNPLPVNVDLVSGSSDILTEETHTPSFVAFDCREFLDVTGPNGVPDGQVDDPALLQIFPECQPGVDASGNPVWPEVLALRTYWPDLADPERPFALNASLFNASLFNASLFNPAIYNASLFNPALLDASVYNWANASLFNASLFNASLFNASLFNASLFNASLFNPAIADTIRNASLFNASLFNASLFNASLFNASLFNASLFNASLFNASLFNASLLNASLFNASLFNASLFNNPVNEPVDGTGGGPGGVFPAEQVYNSAVFAAPLKNGRRLVDVTFQVDVLANTNSGYFFWPLFQNLPDDAQLIIRRVSQSQTVARDPDCLATSPNPETCPLKTFPIFDQEILVNIVGLPDFKNLNPQVLNQVLLQSTFVAPPGGRIYATLRGTCLPDSANPLVCQGGYDPFAVDAVTIPQADENGLSGTWTVLEEEESVSTPFNAEVTFTAKVGSYSGTLPQGSVQLLVDGVAVGSAPLEDVGGLAKAQISFTAGDFGFGAGGSPYIVRARYIEGPGFRCGLGAGGSEAGCFSQPVELIVTPVDVTVSDVDLGVIDVGICDTTAFAGGVISATFDGTPVEVCAESATDAAGQPVLPPTVSFEVSYQDAAGNDLAGPPSDAGTYAVIISVSDSNGNFTGQLIVTLVIEKGSLTILFPGGGPLTYPDTLAGVLNASVEPAGSGSVISYFLGSAGGVAVDSATILDAAPTPYTIVAVASETANYNAGEAQTSVAVDRGTQTVTFVGGDLNFPNALGSVLNATGTAGGPDPTTGAISYSLAPTTPDGVPGTPVDATSVLDAGVYAVTATAAATSNYDQASATATVTVHPGSQTVTFPGGGPLTYPDSLAGILNAVADPPISQTGASISYHLDTATGLPVSGTDILDASDTAYTIVAVVSATSNYNSAEAVAQVVVNRGLQTVSFDGGTVDSGGPIGAALNAEVTPGGPDPTTGALSYALVDGTAVDASTVLGPGDHLVTATAAETGNYLAASATATVTVDFVTFVGFGPPVGAAGDPDDPESVPFVGSFGTNKTLTLKWELFQGGVAITDVDAIHSILLSDVGSPSGNSCGFDPIPTTMLYPSCADTNVCAGGTELRSSGQYVFNWNLTTVPPGCYTLFLNLGSQSGDTIFERVAITLRVR